MEKLLDRLKMASKDFCTQSAHRTAHEGKARFYSIDLMK
jgi:hypothetical protein